MPGLLRSKMPVAASKIDDSENYNPEYSFAAEYSGPPVSYDIPKVVPVDIRRIPVASPVSSASRLDDVTIPVVQPILKSENRNRELSKWSKTSAVVASSLGSGRISRGGFHGSGRVVPCDTEDVENYGRSPVEVPDGAGSSNDAAGRSEIDDVNENNETGIKVSGPVQHPNLEISEHSLSSPDSSPEIVACERIEDGTTNASYRRKRTTVVTFVDQQESDLSSNGGSPHMTHNGIEKPAVRRDVKKGICYRCGKWNRLTKKESCIVCGAKYCRSCLLRAMGSMPEGRKCITCIRFKIDESKRAYLGKSSRILRSLLVECEVKRVMRAELSCEANQLPPNVVWVNSRPLSLRELTALRNCRFPPKKLKPGKYWYDKVAGFWGKDGKKPYQIISPHLDVGDAIKREASNGDTNRLINDREITKTELLMLQLAGVNCEGNTHYWMSADGTFQEVGQKIEREKIWENPRVRFLCAALSLPIPPEYFDDESTRNADGAVLKHLTENLISKILLVGCDQSGTSTLFKQARILFNVPFSQAERQSIKFMIQSNLYRYIAIVLEAREAFEEERLQELRMQRLSQPGPSVFPDQVEENTEYTISERLKSFSDLLHQVVLSANLEAFSPAATQEYAQLVEELLHSAGFQAAYYRRTEMNSLPRAANYFLDRAAEILKVEYEPSEMDILYAEGITSSNGVASMESSLPMSPQNGFMEPGDQNDSSMRFELIRVHESNLGQNCKWLEMFGDVNLVLFCVSLTDYAEFDVNHEGVYINKMLASRNLLETIITNPAFADKNFLLILNKFDLLEEKLQQFPLSQCEWLQDFNPVVTHHHQSSSSSYTNPSMAQRAFHYMAVKFKRWFGSLTGRKLYVSSVTGLEADSVERALQYSREIVHWEEESAATIARNDFSSGSIEASTTS